MAGFLAPQPMLQPRPLAAVAMLWIGLAAGGGGHRVPPIGRLR
jgi:hypothetical protein